MTHLLKPVGKDKKHFDERLQEVRHKNQNGVRYRKRIQEDAEATKRLEEYLKYAFWKNREDE